MTEKWRLFPNVLVHFVLLRSIICGKQCTKRIGPSALSEFLVEARESFHGSDGSFHGN